MAKIGKSQEIAVDKLIPYAKNAKKHPKEQIDLIIRSIEEYGFLNPCLIDKDFNIIAGHGRVMAAKQMGMDKVPCLFVEGLSEAQYKAYVLADNKLTEMGEWDMELVMSELEDLQDMDFDISLTGFEMPEIDVNEPEVEEADIPENAETRCKPGDLWLLGEHRLICGDSTDVSVIEKLMDGAEADMLLTDPPYNVALGMNGSHPLRPSEAKQLHRRTDGLVIENDSWSNDEEFIEFLIKAFNSGMSVIKAGGAFYIWYASTQSLNFLTAAKEAGMQIRQTLIWNKSVFTFGRQDYQWKHKPCLYGWKDGAGHEWMGDRKQATVLDFDKPSRSDAHPTMKPLELFAYQIKNNTRENEAVLDIFGGSGTTIMACEQLKRKAYTCELDPHYCDVILQRWEDFTGKKAELLN